MSTIYVIEVNYPNPDTGEYSSYTHDEAFTTAGDAHQKAHEIEQNDSEVYTTVKPVTVK